MANGGETRFSRPATCIEGRILISRRKFTPRLDTTQRSATPTRPQGGRPSPIRASLIEEQQRHDRRQDQAGRHDKGISPLEPLPQIECFEDHHSCVANHVMPRRAECADPSIAKEIGETGQCSERSHGETGNR